MIDANGEVKFESWVKRYTLQIWRSIIQSLYSCMNCRIAGDFFLVHEVAIAF
jgi:hypothetical protein